GLEQALADTNPDTALNVFGAGANTNPATLARLRGSTTALSTVDSDLWTTSMVATGPVFTMQGGPVRGAIGAEYRSFHLETAGEYIQRISDVVFPLGGSDRDREVGAVFGELFVPLIGANNAVRGARRLELSVAGRYEDYSDFGDAFAPRVGAVWSPVE